MPARGGPYPYLRLPLDVKVEEGMAVFRIVATGGSISSAARTLGMSTTTAWRRYWFVMETAAWRRYWFVMDWTLPGTYGRSAGPIPSSARHPRLPVRPAAHADARRPAVGLALVLPEAPITQTNPFSRA